MRTCCLARCCSETQGEERSCSGPAWWEGETRLGTGGGERPLPSGSHPCCTRSGKARRKVDTGGLGCTPLRHCCLQGDIDGG